MMLQWIIRRLENQKKLVLASLSSKNTSNQNQLIKTEEICLDFPAQDRVMLSSFDDIIKEEEMIQGLSPKLAAHLGYCYGRNDYKTFQRTNYPNMPTNCFNDLPELAVTIVMLERKGKIIYFDPSSCLQYAAYPHEIMADEPLLAKFTSLQAFYIGTLAGIAKEKMDHHLSLSHLVLAKDRDL